MTRVIILFILLNAGALQSQDISSIALIDVQSKNERALSELMGSKGMVLIFTSNVCPYSVYYEGRITQLIAEYSGSGISFVLVNAHKEAKESVAEMENKINTWGLQIPYLADKYQRLMKRLDIRKSPEAVLLKPDYSEFYKGAIDNNPQVASDVKNAYLKENIEHLLNGSSATRGGRPIGCTIRN